LNTKKIKVKTAVNNFSSDIHSGIYYGKSHQTDPQCLTILIPFNIPWQYSS